MHSVHIVIGISWLLQTTRLLNLIVVNKIPVFNVFILSININPNKSILDEVSNFVFRGTALQYFGNISSVF